MIDIAIKCSYSKTKRILLALSLFSVGCNPISKDKVDSSNPQINIDSCLELISKENMNQALGICNKTVDKFPKSPEPLNDRSLIYTLKGEDNLACKDVQNALDLINHQSTDTDPLIKYQIKIRHDSCKKL